MRMQKVLAVVLLAGLPLGGCQTLGAVKTAVTAPSSTTQVLMVDAVKGLNIAHHAFEGVGNTLIVLANANLCTGACASTAKGYYHQAADALAKADLYHDLGNSILTKQWSDAATQAIALATTSHN